MLTFGRILAGIIAFGLITAAALGTAYASDSRADAGPDSYELLLETLTDAHSNGLLPDIATGPLVDWFIRNIIAPYTSETFEVAKARISSSLGASPTSFELLIQTITEMDGQDTDYSAAWNSLADWFIKNLTAPHTSETQDQVKARLAEPPPGAIPTTLDTLTPRAAPSAEYDDYLPLYKRMIKRNATSSYALTKRGIVRYARGKYAIAIRDFTSAIAISARNTKLYNYRGISEFSNGRYDNAISDFTDAILYSANDTQRAMLFNNSGFSYKAREDYDNAIADYTQAIGILGGAADPRILNNRGEAYLARGGEGDDDTSGDIEMAIADYTAAFRVASNDAQKARLYNNLGLAFHAKSDYTNAIAFYQEAIRLIENDADKARFVNNIGLTYHAKGEYGNAILAYTFALDLAANKSDKARFRANRGFSYQSRGDYDDALTDYIAAIDVLGLQDAETYYRRALLYYQQNNYDGAIADFTNAIRLNSGNANFYAGRAAAYISRNSGDDKGRAIADFTSLINLGLDSASVRNGRGLLYHDTLQYTEAIADFSKAIELEPDNVQFYCNRKASYQDRDADGDAALALTDANKILELKGSCS